MPGRLNRVKFPYDNFMSLTQYSAWNPGIESKIPREYETLETLHRTENTFTTLDEVRELARVTGLAHEELVFFRPERLALHELIVRITADIVIFESDNEEDLGINFRRIADTILTRYITPSLVEIENDFSTMQNQLRQQVDTTLSEILFKTEITTKFPNRLWPFVRRKQKQPALSPEGRAEREFSIINSYKQQGLQSNDPLTSAMYRSLYRVLGSIANKRGFLGNDKSLLVELTTRHACNFYGARLIGKKIHTLVTRAISEQIYDVIPDAKKATLISLKGTSAAGKSSLRPMLRKVMRKIGMTDGSYGTISPDVWRRLLIDYDSLGEAYKYAGRLTSYEVNIVDSKLDRYIRGKAEIKQSIPHLMVDRFRFDSFNSEKVSRVLHKTYVKHIDTMYMYFVITPPEETVERGWKRGLDRGRYKSVEDFLGHCVEAYEGIPKLLFKWLSKTEPEFIFEFLDNGVPIDHYPLLIAKGNQSNMDIYRPMGLINIVQYQKINVMARKPAEVYRDTEKFLVERNLDFLQQCIAKIDSVQFIDPESNTVYLQSQKGELSIVNQRVLEACMSNPDERTIFTSLLSKHTDNL